MSIQITSMADIFMILLVFLLKSYGSGVLDITPSKGISMPQASAESSSPDALKIELSDNAILMEGKPIESKNLSAAIEAERKRQLTLAKAGTGVKVDPRVILIADRKVPYSTVKTVLASAAAHGYTDFKLAVVKAN